MIKIVVLFLVAFVSLSAAPTQTNTTFSNEITLESDEYGNGVYQRDATITTTDFKVDNFWSRFFDPQKREFNHPIISKTGTFNIKVEATSACVLDSELPQEGCSGQKPFLINREVLSNSIGNDEYEVVFTLAEKYNASENQNFYPLDVLRDIQYYKEEPIPQEGAPKHSFLGFITGSLDFLLDKIIGDKLFGRADIANVKYTPRSEEAQDRRERYIANIISGIEKKHRMTKDYKEISATQINTATKLNNPASLLHYAKAEKITEEVQCELLSPIIEVSEGAVLCRLLGGLGLDALVPFFTISHTTKIEINTIMADTENALLAMTAQIEEVPYLKDVGGNDTYKLSILKGLLSPVDPLVGLIAGSIKTLLFGAEKGAIVGTPAERVYEFDENKAMTLTMAVTDSGVQVDDFASFKLLKIRSIYGDKMNSCEVKHTTLLGIPVWTKTFKEGGKQSVLGPKAKMWNDDQWITWCQEATGKKGVFDMLAIGNFNLIGGLLDIVNNLLSALLNDYKIEDFTNTINRGLILNIKRVPLDPLYELNRETIEIVKID